MTAATILFWFVTGGALGIVYLLLIGRTVAAIVEGQGWQTAALPILLRMGLALAVFGTASHLGALPVLSALAGFLAARSVGLGRRKAD